MEVFGDSWPGQLIKQETACDFKSCVAVYIVSLLFVLFLPVTYIWVDLQVHEDLGLYTYPQIWARPSQAKPSQANSMGSLQRRL
jgi:hypothetical protein